MLQRAHDSTRAVAGTRDATAGEIKRVRGVVEQFRRSVMQVWARRAQASSPERVAPLGATRDASYLRRAVEPRRPCQGMRRLLAAQPQVGRMASIDHSCTHASPGAGGRRGHERPAVLSTPQRWAPRGRACNSAPTNGDAALAAQCTLTRRAAVRRRAHASRVPFAPLPVTHTSDYCAGALHAGSSLKVTAQVL